MEIEKIKHECTTKCKCNAGGHGVPAFSPCSTTANPSLADVGFKNMFNKKPAWLCGRFGWEPFQNPALHLHQPLPPSVKRQTTADNLLLKD
jgi:hypothetical protein